MPSRKNKISELGNLMVIKQAEIASRAAHCSHTALSAHTYTNIWVNSPLTLSIFPTITPTVKQIVLKAVTNIFFPPPAKQDNFWTWKKKKKSHLSHSSTHRDLFICVDVSPIRRFGQLGKFYSFPYPNRCCWKYWSFWIFSLRTNQVQNNSNSLKI